MDEENWYIAISFLLSLMFSLQQNWRRRQSRFCLEVDQGVRERGTGRRGSPYNVYTYE
jgi:hypothetical protein